MSILTCDGVGYALGVNVILNNVTFAVEPGSKVGVIGVNGAGKTTLLSILMNTKEPTSGRVYVQKNASIGCLEQINDDKIFSKDVLGTALEAFSDLTAMEQALEDLRAKAGSGDEKTIARYADLQDRFLREGGNEYRAKAVALLRKFGFSDADMGSPASFLSGGQKTKLLLARLLLSDPDVLLLD
ncbi:MAG: ABC-F family ATP-binding cassette domain-containing protein [Clostridia bacterium]|nr:ABC-F family ATP-binding cassette domain-containing protein [Clostridia bacterium]